MRRRYPAFALLAVSFATAGVAGAAPPSQAADDETVARSRTRIQAARYLAQVGPENIQVSRDGATAGASRPVTDFSEVMLAIDPTDPAHLLGSSKFFHTPASYGFYTGVFESFDGGLTWDQRQPPGVEDYRLTSDPVNAFDHLGNGYFTLLTRGAGGLSGLDMLRKPAGGAWEAPVEVDSTTLTDKQWIAADQDPRGESPHAGHLYMSWTAVGSQGNPSRIVFARSADGNRTWSAPLELARGSIQGSIPAVGPGGEVYVLWGRDIFGTPSPGRLEVARSNDGGATFGTPIPAAEIVNVPSFLDNGLDDRNFRAPASLPALAVSPRSGTLFAAWADHRHGDADVYLARSADGGESWSDPVRLNDDPVANGIDQIHPQLAVAPGGRVAAMWMDRRLPCPAADGIPAAHVGRENFCLDTFMTRSTDDGATWQGNIRAGAEAWDWSLNLPIVGTNGRTGFSTGFIGDYQGLASSDALDFPFWAATADLGANPGRRQQVFVARVAADRDHAPPPAPTVFLPWVAPEHELAP